MLFRSILRKYLQEKLPEFMVPSFFIFLEQFPLTPNGKIDKKALPNPEVKLAGYIEPTNEIERTISDIWAQVLKLEKVGIQDNFFALGGHSLLAFQIISRIRQILQTEITIRAIFEAPTVEKLSLIVQQNHQVKYPPILATAKKEDIPLSFAQESLYFLEQLEGSSATYNIPLAYELKAAIEPETFQRAIEQIVERHEVLRTNFKLKQQIINSKAQFEWDYIRSEEHTSEL